MDLNEARGLLGQHWGSFQAAVNDPEVRAVPGGVQQFVWQSLRNDYLSRGESLPTGSFAAVNRLLSAAGAQRQAAANLSRAQATFTRTGIDQAITGAMLAPDVDTRSLDQMLGGPELRIRYEAQFIVEGEAVYLPFTHLPGLDVPQSVSGLQEMIDNAAQIAAADYGYEWGGVAAVTGITTT